ncbi:MAG: response regulator [Candidatus Heimdallarchaeaceae archaeon]
MDRFKILIVEDDILVAEDIKQSLQNSRYSVTSIVKSGQEALTKVEKNPPDLILMDIVLKSKMNGIETAHRIRTHFDIPIIYITAYSGDDILQQAKSTQPYGYIIKPINVKELLIAIEIALNKYREKKNIEKHLSESETRYNQLLENINDSIVLLDEEGIISFISDNFLELSGYLQEEVFGQSIKEFLEKGSFNNIKLAAKKKGGRNKILELIWKRKDGHKIITRALLELISEENNFKGCVMVLTDITEHRRVEEELIRSQVELRRLYQYLQNVREKEGKLIAREIHDELGQALTALKIDISYLSRKFLNDIKNKEQFLKKIKSMSHLIDDTIKTVQKISAELRPRLLDDLGLVPAIEWYTEDFKERTKIDCQADLDFDDLELDPDCSTAIFRIFQEAMTNIARHAEATKVNIRLKRVNGKLEIQISDNGKGIREADIYSPNSLGLIGMRERIRPFNGELRLYTPKNGGTTLFVSLPVNGNQEAI